MVNQVIIQDLTSMTRTNLLPFQPYRVKPSNAWYPVLAARSRRYSLFPPRLGSLTSAPTTIQPVCRATGISPFKAQFVFKHPAGLPPRHAKAPISCPVKSDVIHGAGSRRSPPKEDLGNEKSHFCPARPPPFVYVGLCDSEVYSSSRPSDSPFVL